MAVSDEPLPAAVIPKCLTAVVDIDFKAVLLPVTEMSSPTCVQSEPPSEPGESFRLPNTLAVAATEPSLLNICIAYLLYNAASNLSKTVVSEPPTAVSVLEKVMAVRTLSSLLLVLTTVDAISQPSLSWPSCSS